MPIDATKSEWVGTHHSNTKRWLVDVKTFMSWVVAMQDSINLQTATKKSTEQRPRRALELSLIMLAYWMVDTR